ncbi:hypothetical protein [Rufibacter ruber]|uniref:hypothetical protein n=1 Tax=Rufibacter ruber TaxID=1783499 RepID=UPI000832C3B2|nr:hypothetical protein [Rufibacter ruber]
MTHQRAGCPYTHYSSLFLPLLGSLLLACQSNTKKAATSATALNPKQGLTQLEKDETEFLDMYQLDQEHENTLTSLSSLRILVASGSSV